MDFPLLIFTDLDGTLLDHHSYSFKGAEKALHILRQHSIPLIFNSSKTKVVLINSPSNPTGAVQPATTLATIVPELTRRGVWVIADDIYQKMTYADDGGWTSLLSLPGVDPERLVAVHGEHDDGHRYLDRITE